MPKPSIFVSYAHNDVQLKDRLLRHLGSFRRQCAVEIWTDRQIHPGANWRREIDKAMEAATVAILLISSDFLDSDFIRTVEFPFFCKRRDESKLHLFPVIVRPCAWRPVLGEMQVHPLGGKAPRDDLQVDDVYAALAEAIYKLLPPGNEEPPEGQTIALPPHKFNVARLPLVGPHFKGRDQEVSALTAAWEDSETNIVTLTGFGGVGKSALVKKWLVDMRAYRFRKAQRVYGWSFVSQGMPDQSASSELFVESALTWFGDPNPAQGSPWNKGERLAERVAAERTLLVLDGLEPLQFTQPGREGLLKDQAMQAFLRGISLLNRGLCVITSRLPVADLDDLAHDPDRKFVVSIPLATLSPQAGAELLQALKVNGTTAELEQVAREFNGHALTLNLLGNMLRDRFDGNIQYRYQLQLWETDEFRRVIASYEEWFENKPELEVLRLVGLMNRPANPEMVEVIRQVPAIPGLTDVAQRVSQPSWREAVAQLRRFGLLCEPSASGPDTLDAHPFVRAYFAQQLQHKYPDAWREANKRLYQFFRATKETDHPSTEEMMQLCAAVIHGCRAGCHEEALQQVYCKRISQGNRHYSTRRLGALDAGLATLTPFFQESWQQPVTCLSDASKSYVLKEAAYYLRTLGRLQEAIIPLQASLEAYLSCGDLSNAARAAGNLSELYTTFGHLVKAREYAKSSVDYADRSRDLFARFNNRTRLGEVLHQQGREADALTEFHEAERLFLDTTDCKPEFLHSLSGYRQRCLLLEQDEIEEVCRRARHTLQWNEQNRDLSSLLAIALDHLILGCALTSQAQQERNTDFKEAETHLQMALDFLRQTGQQEHIPRGLLARAELYRLQESFSRAADDLDEALKIATHGSMGLHQADCHLALARLHHSCSVKDAAKESLTAAEHQAKEKAEQQAKKNLHEATQRVEGLGYCRRAKEIAQLAGLLDEEHAGAMQSHDQVPPSSVI